MGQTKVPTDRRRLDKALRYMQSALQLLDDAKCRPDVGAHLDLAICRLTEVVADDCITPGFREQ